MGPARSATTPLGNPTPVKAATATITQTATSHLFLGHAPVCPRLPAAPMLAAPRTTAVADTSRVFHAQQRHRRLQQQMRRHAYRGSSATTKPSVAFSQMVAVAASHAATARQPQAMRRKSPMGLAVGALIMFVLRPTGANVFPATVVGRLAASRKMAVARKTTAPVLRRIPSATSHQARIEVFASMCRVPMQLQHQHQQQRQHRRRWRRCPLPQLA
mmetsp:Transcript_30253/g.66156  ORF Transcript_30253/g.66156 Transcript_30253/m.66156 type:complete len:216 (-) Transcript_30253:547-1194(-)